jgi:NADPH2:quinone reductase
VPHQELPTSRYRAWFVDQWGEPETLRLGDAEAAPPAAGEVPIRVHAAGINFFDLLQIRGQYQIKPPFPFVPGAEVAGVREDTGERVFAFASQGGYGERILASANRVFPTPPQLSDVQAAGFLVVYHTSWFVLVERAQLRAGETLLVHAGASGTGMSAIEIGKALGARVIATASTQAKRDFCLSCGADRVIDYTNPAWADQVKAEFGGVDVVYDPVGGDAFDLSFKCINPGGRVAIVGFASGRIPSIAANRLLLKNASAVGCFWGNHVMRHPTYLAETQNALNGLLAQGKLKVQIGSQYPFLDAPRALRDVDHRNILGKGVLVL